MKRLSPATFELELQKLLRCLEPYAPQKVILFGSYARGDYHAGSDVDLLIIKDTDRPFLERSAEIWQCYSGALLIEPLVYTPREFETMVAHENPFIMQILREGMTIYESQP